jgi:hypothetical protein
MLNWWEKNFADCQLGDEVKQSGHILLVKP